MAEFNHIELEEVEKELLKKGYPLCFKEGEKLFLPGQIPTDFYFLQKGIIVLEKSKDKVHRLVDERTFFGLKETLLYEPYEEAALVLSDATIIMIPKARVMSFLRDSPVGRAFVVRKVFSGNAHIQTFQYE
jgi:CRP-like cAMP-binding protein